MNPIFQRQFEKGTKSGSHPAPGLEKRQCSLQICIGPVNNKFRIAIIFRGKGKRISAAEYAAYHKDVDIYWQENAWADTKVCGVGSEDP